MNDIRLISGRSNKPLAEGIAKHLGKKLVNCTIDKFANSEIRVEINEDIRGCVVFIIQTGAMENDECNSVNDYIMETLLLVDTCKRAGVDKVNVILASFPYARGDKKDKPRTPISGSVVTTILKSVGTSRVISLDLHSGQLQGFTKMPFDNLYGINLHIENLKNNLFSGMGLEEINDKYVLVSLDVGGAKRVKQYAQKLKMKYAIMDKQRDYSKPNTVLQSVLVGNVSGKIAICIDDMMDTAGTLLAGVSDLQEHGAISAIVLVTHGILSGPAAERINSCDFINQVIVINTLDQTNNQRNIPKLRVIDSSALFSEVIVKLVVGGSISQLFN